LRQGDLHGAKRCIIAKRELKKQQGKGLLRERPSGLWRRDVQGPEDLTEVGSPGGVGIGCLGAEGVFRDATIPDVQKERAKKKEKGRRKKSRLEKLVQRETKEKQSEEAERKNFMRTATNQCEPSFSSVARGQSKRGRSRLVKSPWATRKLNKWKERKGGDRIKRGKKSTPRIEK